MPPKRGRGGGKGKSKPGSKTKATPKSGGGAGAGAGRRSGRRRSSPSPPRPKARRSTRSKFRAPGIIANAAVRATFDDPAEWSCGTCATTDNLWVCLGSGFVGCGTDEEGHALDHATALTASGKSGYIMELNDDQHPVMCASTKEMVPVDEDTADGCIAGLREALRSIQSLSLRADSSVSRWDRVRLAVKLFGLPFFSEASQQRRRNQDLRATALAKWAHLDLYRGFQTLKAHVVAARSLPSTPVARAKPVDDGAAAAAPTPAPTKHRVPNALLAGRAGLRNLGNTCYMNSTLQCLSNTCLFRDYLFTYKPMSELPQRGSAGAGAGAGAGTGGRRKKLSAAAVLKSSADDPADPKVLTNAIHEVLSRLWTQSLSVYSPDLCLRACWTLFPQFSGFRQHDAHEFLGALLFRLDSECDTLPSGRKKPTKAADGVSAVGSLFSASVATTITCQACGHQSARESAFVGPTTVQIPHRFASKAKTTSRRRGGPACTLTDCLDEAFAVETLAGSCAYDCDGCGDKVEAVKRTALTPAPPVFVVHVMRTDWAHGSKKLPTHVEFPLDCLDLGPYMEGGDEKPKAKPKPKAKAKAKTPAGEAPPLYSLSGLVVHHGRGVNEGHYTAFGRHRGRDVWQSFNDKLVKNVSADVVSRAEAYLLFYERSDLVPLKL